MQTLTASAHENRTVPALFLNSILPLVGLNSHFVGTVEANANLSILTDAVKGCPALSVTVKSKLSVSHFKSTSLMNAPSVFKIGVMFFAHSTIPVAEVVTTNVDISISFTNICHNREV